MTHKDWFTETGRFSVAVGALLIISAGGCGAGSSSAVSNLASTWSYAEGTLTRIDERGNKNEEGVTRLPRPSMRPTQ